MTRVAIRVIDALAVVLLAGGTMAGGYNALSEGSGATTVGQASVIAAQAVYAVAGVLVLWSWRSRSRWLRACAWVWGLAVTWSAGGGAAFYGDASVAAVVPAVFSAGVVSVVTGWWVTQRAAMAPLVRRSGTSSHLQ